MNKTLTLLVMLLLALGAQAQDCNVVLSYEKNYDGTYSLIAFDKAMSGDATFTWSDGSTERYLENVDAGTYCVTMTDASGCMADVCAETDGWFGMVSSQMDSMPGGGHGGGHGGHGWGNGHGHGWGHGWGHGNGGHGHGWGHGGGCGGHGGHGWGNGHGHGWGHGFFCDTTIVRNDTINFPSCDSILQGIPCDTFIVFFGDSIYIDCDDILGDVLCDTTIYISDTLVFPPCDTFNRPPWGDSVFPPIGDLPFFCDTTIYINETIDFPSCDSIIQWIPCDTFIVFFGDSIYIDCDDIYGSMLCDTSITIIDTLVFPPCDTSFVPPILDSTWAFCDTTIYIDETIDFPSCDSILQYLPCDTWVVILGDSIYIDCDFILDNIWCDTSITYRDTIVFPPCDTTDPVDPSTPSTPNTVIDDNTTTVAAVNNVEVSATPNPVVSEMLLKVEEGASQIQEVRMSDPSGMNVMTQRGNNQEEMSINIGHLNEGLYYLKVKTDKGFSVKKVMKL